MAKKRNPGGCQCCVHDCPLFSDDFHRADSTTIGNGWTENAGDWAIVSNEAKILTSNARMTNSASVPSGAHAVRWVVTTKGANSGDKLRLYFRSSTADYIELTVGGSATLDVVIGGSTARSCTVTAAANTYHTIDALVCGASAGTGDSFMVTLNGTIVMWGGAGSATVANTVGTIVGGVGTGSITSAAYFDDFAVTLYRGINEIQRISKTSGTISGGTWDIGNLPGGGSVTAIPYNVSAATLQASLDAVLGAGNVTVSGAAFAPQSLTWIGTYAETDVPMITVDGTNLTGVSPVIAVTEFRAGYGCTECRACSFIPGSRFGTGTWNSINLAVASAADALGTTGCSGINGTYNLDQMTATDCTGCSGCNACQTDECICYGIDGLSITITPSVGPAVTITGIRFCGGVINFISSSGMYISVYFGLNSLSNNIWPRCNDMTSIAANGTANHVTQSSGFCTGWTFTVSDGG